MLLDYRLLSFQLITNIAVVPSPTIINVLVTSASSPTTIINVAVAPLGGLGLRPLLKF